MKNKRLLITLLVLITIISLNVSAFPYGYGAAGEDPLIVMFNDVIKEVKRDEKDWDKLKSIIENSKAPILNLDSFFNVKIYKKLEKALEEKDLKTVITGSVNVVYLSMMEKFELIKQKEFKDYDFCKGRLALNDKYYREIFRGNVIKYDKKNGTNINDTILNLLQKIPGTIGKPGKFGMGEEAAHPDDYDEIYKEIKSNLKVVFPGFEG